MIKTTKMLLNELSGYSDPFGKTNRLIMWSVLLWSPLEDVNKILF